MRWILDPGGPCLTTIREMGHLWGIDSTLMR